MSELMHLSRRNLVRIISYGLGVLLITMGFAVTYYIQAIKYRRFISNTYQQSFSDLSDYMNVIDTSLQKGIYANTPLQIVELSSEILRSSSAAKNSLSNMPFYASNLGDISKFLSQAGDYINSLAKKVSSGVQLTDEDRATIKKLSDTATVLNTHINALRAELQQGKMKVKELESIIQKNAGTNGPQSLSEEMVKVQDDVQNYPELVYDGPFSEHIDQMEPSLLKGKAEASAADAKKIASDFLGVNVGDLADQPESSGLITTYNFSIGTTYVQVTKTGGFVLYVTNSRVPAAKNISYEQAIAKAHDFLSARGFVNMKESYYYEESNVLVVNFAYVQNGVICYPDLIKVGIALDDGSLISFDGAGYLMSHINTRDITPSLTQEQAAKVVNKSLTITNTRLTIIPTTSKGESLCWEFKTTSPDNKVMLVYVNAKTGMEENILILLQEDNGILTM